VQGRADSETNVRNDFKNGHKKGIADCRGTLRHSLGLQPNSAQRASLASMLHA